MPLLKRPPIPRPRILSVRLSEGEYSFLLELSAREDLTLCQAMRKGVRLLKETECRGGGSHVEQSESEPQRAA
jgi:hypothetical protein